MGSSRLMTMEWGPLRAYRRDRLRITSFHRDWNKLAEAVRFLLGIAVGKIFLPSISSLPKIDRRKLWKIHIRCVSSSDSQVEFVASSLSMHWECTRRTHVEQWYLWTPKIIARRICILQHWRQCSLVGHWTRTIFPFLRAFTYSPCSLLFHSSHELGISWVSQADC